MIGDIFTVSDFWDKLFTQFLVFSMSFVSVFYGVQLTKYLAKLWDDYNSSKIGTQYEETLPLDDFVAMPLIRKEVLSHDTAKFTFALPSPDHVLGLPTGQHVSLKYYMADKTAVQRSYTPVSDNTTVGEFSLVIKVYKPLPPKFPEGGKMSQHLDAMKIGDTILVHGPKGHTEYKGSGKFSVKPLGKPMEQRYSRHIGLMAGGTGVTPMLQVLHHIFRDPKDTTTQVRMIYANQTEEDILVRKELEELQSKFPNRFTLWYTVDRAENEKWAYDVGFINQAMVEQHLMFPKNVKDAQFFMCGPPPMIKFACLPALQALGYSEKDWVIF
jgi:cytochrome-b5 reductase